LALGDFGVLHTEQIHGMTENIINEAVMDGDFAETKGNDKTSDKALSTNSNNEI